MSKRVQYAQSFPELPAAPAAETGRVLFYARAGQLYYRQADGTEVGPLGVGGAGGGAPANMVTTDTTQTITGAKTFAQGVTSYHANNAYFYAYGDDGSETFSGGGFHQATAPAASLGNPTTVAGFDATAKWWNGTSSEGAPASFHASALGGVARWTSNVPLYEGEDRVLTTASTIPAPSNMVTTDTDQTITGAKTLTADFTLTGGYNTFGTFVGAKNEYVSGYGVLYPGAAEVGAGAATAETPNQSVLYQGFPNFWDGTQSVQRAASLFFEAPGGDVRIRTDVPIYENANRVYSAGNLPPAPANMVTTDTDQTISGAKTFSQNVALVSPSSSIIYTQRTDTNADAYLSPGLIGATPDGVGWADMQAARVGGVVRWTSTVPLYEFSNRVYSAANLPPAPANMVTTDTTQTITGRKTLEGGVGSLLTLRSATSPAAGLAGQSPALTFTPLYMTTEGEEGGADLKLYGTVAGDGANPTITTAVRLNASSGIFDNGSRVYSANNPPPAQAAPSNMVTTDTDQTITGYKVFSNAVEVSRATQATSESPAPSAFLSFTSTRWNGSTATLVGGDLAFGWDAASAGSLLSWNSAFRVSALYEGTNRVLTTASTIPAPANMVTTDTEQTITGAKTFSAAGSNGGVLLKSVGVNTGPTLGFLSGDGFYSDLYQHADGNALETSVDFRAASLYTNGNRVYSAANLPPAPSNMVTTDTTQTITGSKTWSDGGWTTKVHEYGVEVEGANGEGSYVYPNELATFGPSAEPGQSTIAFVEFGPKYNNGTGSATSVATLSASVAADGTDPRMSSSTPLYEGSNRVLTTASTLPAPANMVTTDTAQTITGRKTFSALSTWSGASDEAGLSSEGFYASDNSGGATYFGSTYCEIQAPSATPSTPTQTADLYLTPKYWNGSASAPAFVTLTARWSTARSRGELSTYSPFYATELYDNGNRVLTTASTIPAPASMVTTDTTQTITGAKLFTVAAGEAVYVESASPGGSIMSVGGTSGNVKFEVDDAGAVAYGQLREGSNRVYSAANPPPAPANMVTTDTTQTITGLKAFYAAAGSEIINVAPTNGLSVNGTRSNTPQLAFNPTSRNAGATTSHVVALYGTVETDGTRARLFVQGQVEATQVWEGPNRVYSAANLPPAPSNMVTTDTTQTITGTKTLTRTTAGTMLFTVAGRTAPFDSNENNPATIRLTASRDSTSTVTNTTKNLDLAATLSSLGASTLTLGGETVAVTGELREQGNRVYSVGNKVPVAGLSATGTADATTFLRGDNTWAAPAAPSNMVTTDTTQTITARKKFALLGANNAVELASTDVTTAGLVTSPSPTLWFTSKRWTGTTDASETVAVSAKRASATAGAHWLDVDAPLRATEVWDNGSRVYSVSNKVPATGLSATGTKDATTFLRGDDTWAAPTAAAPANMATTDTAQVLTGVKTFPPNALLMRNAAGTVTAEPYSDVNPPDSLLLTENAVGVVPPTPAAGLAVMYADSLGDVFIKGDTGVVTSMTWPAPYTRAQMQVVKNAGAATVSNVGLAFTVLTATAATADDTTGRWLQHTTAATANNVTGCGSGTSATVYAHNYFQRGWKVEGIFGFRFGPDVSSQRVWVGFFSADPTASDTPAVHLAAVRYNPAISPNWQCVTAAGTSTQTVTTSTTPAVASEFRRLRIFMDATEVRFYADDVLLATHTTNLPTATTPLGWRMSLTTLVAAARSFRWNRTAFLDYA